MKARHILLVGSAPADPAELRQFSAGADLLICADGGTDSALAAGLRPDLVLGDMDSISTWGRAELARLGIKTVEYPRDKDKTDLELAFDHALESYPSRITALGALGGGRLDHTLGNILLLMQPRLRGVDVRLVDTGGCAFVVWARRELEGAPNDYVSLLPLTEVVAGIRTQGLKYALQDDYLMQGSTRGLSNEMAAGRATISVTSGCLLVRHERGRQEDS